MIVEIQEKSFNAQTAALLNEKFLATLSQQKDREIYARVIALDINENPIDRIEGKVTGGSINIDGSSTIRRTCSLTLVCDNIDINDFYWGIKTKFKLEIGLHNKLAGEYAFVKGGEYPEIVWFSQGCYIVTGFNTSISTNNCTVSLTGKDKMCLLNGDLGGQLFASIDFGTEEKVENAMEEVSLMENTSSESIILKDYYIKPDTSILDQHTNDEDLIIQKTLLKTSVYNNNPIYSFVKNQKQGNYYKDGNIYKLAPIDLTPEEKENSSFKYYDMYKLIENPIELYEQITLTKYEKNKYCYQNNGGVYIKEESDSWNPNRIYYQYSEEIEGPVNNIPVIFYEPNKYYYKKKNNNNYFVLDTTAVWSSEKTYYQLKTVYQKYSEVTKEKITIEKIIREAIHNYAKEPYHNIIINDLDDYGLEQLTYKGDKPLYALYNTKVDQFTNLILSNTNQEFENIINQIGFTINPLVNSITSYNGSEIVARGKSFLGWLKSDNKIYINNIGEDYIKNDGDIIYTVAKIEYGTDIGYRLTDLTYAGDLISSVGDTLTSVLDKIKEMLGEFEYFYDINGKFIFQKKKTYLETSWSQITDNDDESFVDYANNKNKFSFNFEGNTLISAIQNSPVLNNLKNDYIVWGKRKSISGAEIPIHARYAIDKKPVLYKALDNKINTTDIQYVINQGLIPKNSYSNIEQETYDEIANFSLTDDLYPYLGLTRPIKQNNGTWTPGWWHISDWARYYKLLKNTDKDPLGTMKFYSSNDENGCVPLSSLLNITTLDNNKLIWKQQRFLDNPNNSVWLIEIHKSTNIINLGHNSGIYNNEDRTSKIYYESKVNEQGKIIDTLIQYDENGQPITVDFASPYRACTDIHTYPYFSQKLKDWNIYFYNPSFPLGETVDELISKQIAENYQEWEKKYGIYVVDWRELIYQMALDYFAGQGCSEKEPIYLNDIDGNQYKMIDPDHFLYEVGRRNPYYYPTGYTGYEQYYTDMQGFWRKLYNPEYIPEPVYSIGEYKEKIETNASGYYYHKTKNWVKPEVIDYNIDYYISTIKEGVYQQYNEINSQYRNLSSYSASRQNEIKAIKEKYLTYLIDLNEDTRRLYWNKEVFEHPETLDFWIDFLDSDLELAQFSIPQVGDRTKVVNESKASSIIYTEVPGFILYDQNERNQNGSCNENALRREITLKSGYNFIYVPKGFSQYFTISYRTASLKNKIDALLYQFGYCIENITITSIPIYYLEPNTRIFVQDKNTQIDGEYLVSKITIPLTYNGTMSITATKAIDRLY